MWCVLDCILKSVSSVPGWEPLNIGDRRGWLIQTRKQVWRKRRVLLRLLTRMCSEMTVCI